MNKRRDIFDKMIMTCVVMLVLFHSSSAQHNVRMVVKDKTTKEQLSGVSVTIKGNDQKGTISDINGMATLRNLSTGDNTILFTLVGYLRQEAVVRLPDTSLQTIFLVQDPKALSNIVVISSTRGNERMENATTKVEVLGQEEMNEESTLKPGNIASILGDVSGVQIQQSSATSGNANVRIQGLDGRYTQILKDGMPLYGGYSGGFGILSIPPLDLKQVELIKGSSSTLYGGGAIGGLVNVISKKPSMDPEASFLVNQSTLKETNLNAFYSQRWKKAGFTLFGGQTFQKEADVDKDGFSDVPNMTSTLIHPTLFYYPSSKTWLSLGWTGSFEKRLGGDMKAISGSSDPDHPYFEKNQINRNILTLLSESKISNTLSFTLKGSYSRFKRDETTDTYYFNGRQDNYYAELFMVKRAKKHQLIGGVNVTGYVFSPSSKTPVPVGKFSNNILGIFSQDTWRLFNNTKLEAGLRFDHHIQYGNFLLPRIALFQRFNEHWGARAGFGMGYITPNPLTPQTKDYTIYQLQPLDNVKAEKSYAGNAEVNYKTDIGEDGALFINQAFFLTTIRDPVVSTEDIAGKVFFANESNNLITKGSDTYIQLQLPAMEFYLGYTYTNALRTYLPVNRFVLYTPMHRAAATAMYELSGKWRIGLEASYNGYQRRDDYSKTPGYLFIAAMVERKFGPKWSLVLNCENALDERQSRHESLYTGPVTSPQFKTLWAPIDGRVLNLCLRFRPFEKAG